MNFDIVIVGSGQAGFQTAASLRQEGFDGSIAIVGDEPGLPYQRPPLSKTYLKEGVADRLYFRDAGFFETNRILLEDGARVASVNRHDKQVRLEDGRSFGYGHLVLATGARNRRLPIEGIDLDGVVDLRTLADADAFRATLPSVKRLAVIGGGFIGLEIAATARAMGAEVTVLEATDRLMSRVVSPPVSAHFLEAHTAAGIDVRLHTMGSRILGSDGRASGVELQNGDIVAADLVLVAAGVVANAELAEAAGLYVHDGIRVDDVMATEDPDISAIGDCASFPFGHDGLQTRLESVQNAVDQAKAVARTLTGTPTAMVEVPWFWTQQFDLMIQMVGVADHGLEWVRRGDPATGAFALYGLADGVVTAVQAVNAGADYALGRRLVRERVTVDPDRLTDPATDLKALLPARR